MKMKIITGSRQPDFNNGGINMKCSKTVFSLIFLYGAVAFGGGDEITYSRHIAPLVAARCGGCHGKDAAPEYQAFKKEKEKWLAKGQGMRMDSYSHLISFAGWPNSGALMRRLDDGGSNKDGKSGNMYQHLGSTDEERQKNLALFKGWVGSWVLKRWPEISKEELNAIRVPY